MKKLHLIFCILFFSLCSCFGQANPLESWTASKNKNGRYFLSIDKSTITYIDKKDEHKRVSWTYTLSDENIIFGNCIFCSADENTASLKELIKIVNSLKENQNIIRYSANKNEFRLYFSQKPDTYRQTESKAAWKQTRYFYNPTAGQILEIVINKNFNPIASKKDVEKLADKICEIAW